MLGNPLEYFNGRGRRLFTDPAYPDDPREQVARVLVDGATANGVYGIKVFPWQVDLVAPHLRWSEALPNLRFVYLERRDLLGQAISLLRANQTQQWRSNLLPQGEAAYDDAAILEHLHGIAREQARWAGYVARIGADPVRLAYEDIIENPPAAVHAVAELMGVEIPPSNHPAQAELAIQRDSVNETWRTRFLEENSDGSFVDAI